VIWFALPVTAKPLPRSKSPVNMEHHELLCLVD